MFLPVDANILLLTGYFEALHQIFRCHEKLYLSSVCPGCEDVELGSYRDCPPVLHETG